MKTTNFCSGDNTIDSRNVIARQEELQSELDALTEALEDAEKELSDFLTASNESEDGYEEEVERLTDAVNDAKDALELFDRDELEALDSLVSEAESSPDWTYGETLIHDDYFVEYTEELVNECWEMPKEFNSGNWPWNHMTMDWDSAAEELKRDYMSVDFEGHTYWIRA